MRRFSKARGPDSAQLARAVKDAREFARRHGLDEAKTAETALNELLAGTWWVNDGYQVCMRDVDEGGWPPMIWLSIRRLDREPMHDWRELQQIKNLLVGPEHEAVELYPAESRLVDTANQYHLWVLRSAEQRFPVGWAKRAVSDEPLGKSKQRPFAAATEE